MTLRRSSEDLGLYDDDVAVVCSCKANSWEYDMHVRDYRCRYCYGALPERLRLS